MPLHLNPIQMILIKDQLNRKQIKMIVHQKDGNVLGLFLHRMATAVLSGVILEVLLLIVKTEEWIREN